MVESWRSFKVWLHPVSAVIAVSFKSANLGELCFVNNGIVAANPICCVFSLELAFFLGNYSCKFWILLDED